MLAIHVVGYTLQEVIAEYDLRRSLQQSEICSHINHTCGDAHNSQQCDELLQYVVERGGSDWNEFNVILWDEGALFCPKCGFKTVRRRMKMVGNDPNDRSLTLMGAPKPNVCQDCEGTGISRSITGFCFRCQGSGLSN